MFNAETFQDFVVAHGYGEAIDEGMRLGQELIENGGDVATAAFEVVARGLTKDTH